VENINPTFSRERESQITGKEDTLIPLHRDLDASTINQKGKHMHLVKVKRRKHFSTIEIRYMWRSSAIRRDTI